MRVYRSIGVGRWGIIATSRSGSRKQEAESSHPGAGNMKPAERSKSMQGLLLSKPTLNDILPLARPHPVNLLRQCHQLRTKPRLPETLKKEFRTSSLLPLTFISLTLDPQG